MRRGKNKSLEDYSFAICRDDIEEACMHLFFECPFSRACWNCIGISWNLDLPPLDMIIEARSIFGSTYFREITITACWIIWTSRNRLIFDGILCTIAKWKDFKTQIGLVCIKAKPHLAGALELWLENLS